MIGEAGRVYIYIYIYVRRPTTNDTPKKSETAVGAINLLLRLINRRLHSFSPIGILPIGNICYHTASRAFFVYRKAQGDFSTMKMKLRQYIFSKIKNTGRGIKDNR